MEKPKKSDVEAIMGQPMSNMIGAGNWPNSDQHRLSRDQKDRRNKSKKSLEKRPDDPPVRMWID